MKTTVVVRFVLPAVLAAFLAFQSHAQTPATVPAITTPPASQLVTSGTTATFTVVATGTAPLRYQWYKNGEEINRAESSSLALTNPRINDAGIYSVKVSNAVGSVISAPATLTVNGTAGTITTALASVTAKAGTEVKLTLTATGTGLTYQWRYNGRLLRGTTGATLTLANAGTTVAGDYTVNVLAQDNLIAASAARVTITTDTRLVNIATRGMVGTEDDEILIAGFVTRGTGNKKVLLRAVGPTLAQAPFNVTGVLANPRITLYRAGTSTSIATNAVWGGTTALTAAFSQVGAFPLPASSADSALSETLSNGGYTAHVTGPANARGIALVEVYDADTGTPAVELANISTRAMVGAVNDGLLIAGFVITGTTSDTVLIRGVSQSMGTLHGMRRALGNSQVAVFDSDGREVAANSVWGKVGRGNPNDEDDDDLRSLIEETGARVGAFPLPRGSTDSVLLLTLKPGAYTAQVSGRNNSSGIALVEIYEVR